MDCRESARPRFLETYKVDGTNDELKVVQYEDLMPVSDGNCSNVVDLSLLIHFIFLKLWFSYNVDIL